MRRRLQTLAGRLAFVGFGLRLVWQAAPVYTGFWAALLVVQGLVPPLIISLTKRIVDAANVAIGGGLSADNLAPLAVPVGIVMGLYLLQQISGSVSEWIGIAQGELVGDHVKALIHERCIVSDYGYYESPEYHDQLEQVNTQAGPRTLQLLQSVGSVVQSLVTLVSIGAILVSYNVLIPLALVASTAPAFFVILRHNRRYHAWWQAATERRRRVLYYDSMLTTDATAAEVRIYGLGPRFREAYRTFRASLFAERVALVRRQALAKLGAGFNATLVTLVVLAWVGMRAVRGLATLGDLALFYQAFSQGQGVVAAMLQGVGQVYTHTLFLEPLHAFLNQTDEVRDPEHPVAVPSPIREGIVFEDVTFTYPRVEAPVLRAFNLTIPAGKVVAVVGENGAGKSTFIKLLCRFYDPDAGRITIDGVDLRAFTRDSLRRQISVMFQAPMRYQMTAEENIRLGDLASEDDLSAVQTAARGGGAEDLVERLPRGYETLLGRWFEGGIELSGGEWQRIALARSFFRRASLVILDEPTSAMDSWTENEWLSRFRAMVDGQTALVITHRFTTAMRADIIHVLDKGIVVESGSHAELLAAGGRYATSWRAQMEQAQASGDGAAAGAPSSSDIGA